MRAHRPDSVAVGRRPGAPDHRNATPRKTTLDPFATLPAQ
jgi:hypothetical protein